MMADKKRWGVRLRDGHREVIWIDVVMNGFWRGIRLPDGKPTRGPVYALLGRYHGQREAESVRDETEAA